MIIHCPLRSARGFTLVELLIVITIIGILAGIAVPMYLGQRTKAAETEATTNLQALRLLGEQYFAENGCYYQEGNACTNKSFSAYNTDANLAIMGFTTGGAVYLPGFKPGKDTSLKYTYRIDIANLPGSPAASSAFTATATGKAGTIVAGTKFCIDQDNNPTCP